MVGISGSRSFSRAFFTYSFSRLVAITTIDPSGLNSVIKCLQKPHGNIGGSISVTTASIKGFALDLTILETSSIELDKAYIGSCTGAKLEDLKAVAKILKGRKVKIRTEILPAAISIYKKAVESGLVKIFLDAGVTVGPPTCGACCGAHMGVLAKDEICVSTTNRNFPGRMGHVESQTYLTSPLVAAASAVTGKLTDPRDLN